MIRFALLTVIALAYATAAQAWTTETATSPVDDSPNPLIWQNADRTYTTRLGKQWRPNLQIACESRRTIFAFSVPELFVSDHGAWGAVTARVDKRPAVQIRMIAGNDHKSLALIGSPAIRMAKAVAAGRTIFVRILPVNEPAFDITFDVDGLDEALKPIRKECSW